MALVGVGVMTGPGVGSVIFGAVITFAMLAMASSYMYAGLDVTARELVLRRELWLRRRILRDDIVHVSAENGGAGLFGLTPAIIPVIHRARGDRPVRLEIMATLNLSAAGETRGVERCRAIADALGVPLQ
jgi:hypothetical protein